MFVCVCVEIFFVVNSYIKGMFSGIKFACLFPSLFMGCLVQDLHRMTFPGSRMREIKMFGNIVSLCFGPKRAWR